MRQNYTVTIRRRGFYAAATESYPFSTKDVAMAFAYSCIDDGVAVQVSDPSGRIIAQLDYKDA